MIKKLLLSTVCTILTFFAFSQNPIANHGQLSINGSKVVNEHGDTVSFAGMSLFWSNTYWGGEKYYNYDVVEYLYTEWEAPIIRASMGVEASGGYITDKNNKARVIEVIDAAIDLGLYVIVDWHSHEAQNYTSDAIAFFDEISELYGDYPNIIYEIYNEPLSVSWTTVIKPYAVQVINAIRANDPDNIIVVGTPNWSQKVKDAANSPLVGKNIAYTLHFYAGTHTQWLRDDALYAINKGICLIVTEWGSVKADGTGSVATDETNLWVEFMKTHKLTNCNWALNDKNEGASALKSGASKYGGWDETDYTSSGLYSYDLIKNWEGNYVSILELTNTTSFILSHNKTNLLINTNDYFGMYKVNITDISGRLVYSNSFANVSTSIQTDSFKQGVYVVTIITDENTYSGKIKL